MGDTFHDHLCPPSRRYSSNRSGNNTSGNSTPSNYVSPQIVPYPSESYSVVGSPLLLHDRMGLGSCAPVSMTSELCATPIYINEIDQYSGHMTPSEGSMIGAVNPPSSPYDQSSAPILLNYDINSASHFQYSPITSPIHYPNSHYENDHKRVIRLAKNREAAKESRRKKKDYIKTLEERVVALERQNRELVAELKRMRSRSNDKP